MNRHRTLLRVTLFLLLLLGCNFLQAAPELTSTPLPSTPTNTSTNTPVPTDTPLPPTATPYPSTITQKSAEMVLIPAGEFIMGSDTDGILAECQKYSDNCSQNYFKDEFPLHRIYLDAYYMDVYEVTNVLYSECVAAGECDLPSLADNKYYADPVYADYPVIYVNWFDANAYCEWRGGSLPTEAEWEKAARGSTPLLFPWGDEFEGDLVNFCDKNCKFDWANRNYDDGYPNLAPVGSFPGGISPYGLFDMAGNAWEWVADWYDSEYYSVSPSSNPEGPNAGEYRVLRGGTWNDFNFSVRTADRFRNDPSVLNDLIGFRCASSPAASTQISITTPSSPITLTPGIQAGTAPIIESVNLRYETTTDGLTVLQDITFGDPQGDAYKIHYEIVSATAAGLKVTDGMIDISVQKQKLGAIITGKWNCGGSKYDVTLRVTVLDRKGNVSNEVEYIINCK